jgi:hypothetical protein
MDHNTIVNKINIQIKAIEYTLNPRTNLEYWLDIKWDFINFEKYDCYLLSKGFLSISMKDFLLIDHTTESGSYKMDAHIDPNIQFEKLKSENSVTLEYSYPLPRINAIEYKEINVIGKFSVSQERPNAEWTKGSYWKSIQTWENIIFSSVFVIKADE